MARKPIYKIRNISYDEPTPRIVPPRNRFVHTPDPPAPRIEEHYDADEEVNSWTYGPPQHSPSWSQPRRSWSRPTTPHVF